MVLPVKCSMAWGMHRKDMESVYKFISTKLAKDPSQLHFFVSGLGDPETHCDTGGSNT